MAAPCYIAYNGVTSALTLPLTPVATSAVANTAKTMLQVKPGSAKIRIIEWGYVFGSVPTAPVMMELIETGTVFATVTTIGSGILAYNDATGAASQAVAGTAATGFTATAEGTITATRLLGLTYDTATYFKQQFPLGREPEVQSGFSLRIRATPTVSAATNVTTYVVWEE